MPVEPSRKDEVVAAIRRQYDEYTVMKAREMPLVRRLPFGQLGLDYISGGGMPFGRMSRFWGGYAAGKSLSCWNLIANAQRYGEVMYLRLEHQAAVARIAGDKQRADQFHGFAEDLAERFEEGLECVYINIENQIDPAYVASIGVDIDRLEVVNQTRIEDVGTIMVDMLSAFHVIVVDSCSHAISTRELKHEDGLHQDHIGVRPKKWGDVLAFANDRLQDDNLIVYIDQIRTPIGMGTNQRMATEKPPGGRYMEHASSMTLHFMKGDWLFRRPDGSLARKEASGTDTSTNAFDKLEPHGKEILVRCDKSRVSRGERTALLHYDQVVQNFDRLHDIDKFARYFHVVERTGDKSSWYKLPDGRKVQKLREHLDSDETLAAAVEDVTLRCAADPEYEQRVIRGEARSLVSSHR